MPDARERLIETAVRPLGENAEVKVAAAGLLEETVPQAAEDADEMIRRWDELDGKSRCFRWRTVFLAGALLFSGAILVEISLWTINYRRAFNLLTGTSVPGIGTSPALPPTKKTLTAEEELILQVDISGSRAAAAKALRELHPDNPVYFAKHGEAHLAEHGKLPTNFLEDARRIDPANAWYLCVAAAREADGCVEKKPMTAAGKAKKTPPEWEIKDRAKLERSLDLLRQARGLTEFRDHKAELMGQQVALLRQDTQLERLGCVGFMAGIMAPDMISMRKMADVIAAKASLLVSENDPDGLRELIADVDAMNRNILRAEPSTVVGALVQMVIVGTPPSSLADAAEKLGLEEEAERFGRLRELADQTREARKKRQVSVDGMDFQLKSGFIPGLTLPMLIRQVAEPPTITEADLKPGRLTDHELVSMFCAVGAFFLLGCSCILVWANRFRLGRPVRELTRRVESLLRPSDWAWIIGGGVVLPFSVVFSINRLTPWGGRDFSVFGMKFVLPLGHFFALFLLCVILPVLLARWRLETRAGGLGFSWRLPWSGWAAVFLTLAYVVAIGMAVPFSSVDGLAVVTTLLLLAKLWIPTVAGRALLGKGPRLLKSGTVARVLVPAYAAAALLMIGTVPVFKAAEQYWFERDQLMMLDPEAPGMNRYEYKVAARLQEELREMVDQAGR